MRLASDEYILTEVLANGIYTIRTIATEATFLGWEIGTNKRIFLHVLDPVITAKPYGMD